MSNLERTAKFVDNWWKILSVVTALVFFIYAGASQWIKVKEMDDQNRIRDEKSDKRYEEAIKMYEEIKSKGIEFNKDYTRHLVEDAYFRGKIEAEIDNLKDKE